MNEKHSITKAGKRKLEKELAYLKNKKQKELAAQIKEHRGYCDFAENTTFTQTLDQQIQVKNRMIEIENLLLNAEVIHVADEDRSIVDLGRTVTIKYLPTGPEEQYTIVSSMEADPFANKISSESPIGKNLLGSQKGEEKEIVIPSGSIKIQIKDIQ